MAILVLGIAAVVPWADAAGPPQPFAADSPMRTPVPAAAELDPNSASMIAGITGDNAMYANLVDFAIPIYDATPESARYAVRCTETDWGTCPFDGHQIPIPSDARPHTGSDAAMVVIDEQSRLVYEFWQARHDDGGWVASWGAVNSLDGSGWGGASTGSGASRLAGVIRMSEIAGREIPHALAIQVNNVCANNFRAPAVKTDGTSSRSDCIPEGARLRLDPAVDLSTLKLATVVATIARALQVYGAYVVDAGAAPISVSFELDPTATQSFVGDVYRQAGMRWDYDNMPGIPYGRLQVLA